MRGGAGTCQEKLQTCPQVKHSIRVPLYVILDMVTGQSAQETGDKDDVDV